MRARLLLCFGLLVAGCANDVCQSVAGTCVALRIDGSGSVSMIALDLSGAASAQTTVSSAPQALPVVMPLTFHPGVSGVAQLQVVASFSGTPIGTGATSIFIEEGKHSNASVALSRSGNSDAIDAGTGTGKADFGGGGGSSDLGAGCGMCPPNAACDPGTHQCMPKNLPVGSACSQTMDQCQLPGQCTMDNICRIKCGANVDCQTGQAGPTSACDVNFGISGGQTYCGTSCNPVMSMLGGMSCPSGGSKCVVVDFSQSATDCEYSNTNSTTSCNGTNDCAVGYSCYFKSGVPGTCYVACQMPNQPCTSGGTCQVPVGKKFGVCCPSGNCL